MGLEFALALGQHADTMWTGPNAPNLAFALPLAPSAAALSLARAHELGAPAESARPQRLLLVVGGATRPAQAWLDEFGRSGWRCVGAASTGAAAVAARSVKVDLVLLRSAAVTGSLLEVLQTLCAQFDCPVLVLAAAADPFDEVLALEAGACAYLAEPIEARRLRANLSVWLRPSVRPRSAPAAPDHGSDAAPLLAGALKRLFQTLCQAQGRPVERTRLLAALGGRHQAGETPERSRALDTQVCRLRKTLQQQQTQWLVQAVRGEGYRLSLRGN